MNLDKSNQIKNYLKNARDEEMKKYSPKGLNSSTITQRSISIPGIDINAKV